MTERLEEIDSEDVYHVHPTFGRPHVTDQKDNCWCQPAVQFEGDGAIIIHEAEQ